MATFGVWNMIQCNAFVSTKFSSECDLSISKPGTIEKLKQRIKEEIAAIPEQMTRRVMENFRARLEQCLRN
ncbi:hypothetical protein Cfor_07086, partial [Coptotermes formosanus]